MCFSTVQCERHESVKCENLFVMILGLLFLFGCVSSLLLNPCISWILLLVSSLTAPILQIKAYAKWKMINVQVKAESSGSKHDAFHLCLSAGSSFYAILLSLLNLILNTWLTYLCFCWFYKLVMQMFWPVKLLIPSIMWRKPRIKPTIWASQVGPSISKWLKPRIKSTIWASQAGPSISKRLTLSMRWAFNTANSRFLLVLQLSHAREPISSAHDEEFWFGRLYNCFMVPLKQYRSSLSAPKGNPCLHNQ